jgi:aryl-alcohol dehydrogenase-like predicted oxidoreductase
VLFRRLGASGPLVSAIGLGCLGMSEGYGAPHSEDRKESIATIQAALDNGLNLIDTADFYGSGHNEMLIGEALQGGRRDRAILGLKFGVLRDPAGGLNGGLDNRPAAIRNYLAYTLKRLGVDYIDVYRPARLDPAVPIEDTVGAIADLVRAGYVRHIGLSEVGAATIRRAAAVHPIVDLQIEYSLLERRLEGDILDTCRELGIAITAYGVLARGLLGGHLERSPPTEDYRSFSPRFQGDNLRANLELAESLRSAAAGWRATPAQAAIAWVLAQGDDIIPLVGVRSRARLNEAIAATELKPTIADLQRVAIAVPPGAAVGAAFPPDHSSVGKPENSA